MYGRFLRYRLHESLKKFLAGHYRTVSGESEVAEDAVVAARALPLINIEQLPLRKQIAPGTNQIHRVLTAFGFDLLHDPVNMVFDGALR
jgi:hypothetical protein